MYSPITPAPWRRSKLLLATTVFSLVGGLVALLLLWSAWRSRAANSVPRSQFQEEQVHFDAGKGKLAGTLVRPLTPGPHPAVVFLTDAGPSDRTEAGTIPPLAHHLAENGFACLSWDRPGVGRSSGDYLAQAIPDRADEALAAVRFLQARSDIRRSRIGFVGIGEGGTAAPIAAQSGDVAFVITVGSCQLAGGEQELYRVEHALRADGLGDTAIAEATELARLKVRVLRGDGAFEEFDETQKLMVRRPWFANVGYCKREAFNAARLTIQFDPAPAWAKVHCPVLAVFGANDTTAPAEASANVIRQGLQQASNADVTIKIVPRADHRITVSDTGGAKEALERSKRRAPHEEPELAPGYVETLTSWLAARFDPKR
jgi:pimeloyl-ACP methyl ester carboxylesterase